MKIHIRGLKYFYPQQIALLHNLLHFNRRMFLSTNRINQRKRMRNYFCQHISLLLAGTRRTLRLVEHGSAEQFNSKLKSSNQFLIVLGNIVIES